MTVGRSLLPLHLFALGGLLLRDAVQRAAFLDEIEAIDAYHLAVAEELAQHAEGAVVVLLLAESRY